MSKPATLGLHATPTGPARVLEGVSAKTQKPYKLILQPLMLTDGPDFPTDPLAAAAAGRRQAVCVVDQEYPVGKTLAVLASSFRVSRPQDGRDPRLELGTVSLALEA